MLTSIKNGSLKVFGDYAFAVYGCNDSGEEAEIDCGKAEDARAAVNRMFKWGMTRVWAYMVDTRDGSVCMEAELKKPFR